LAYYVYILASKKHGTLYIGVTRDLVRRVYEHKTKAVPGFTSKYGVNKLVLFEIYDDPATAIAREKELKKWRRDWKTRLIEEQNPNWDDLYPGMTTGGSFPKTKTPASLPGFRISRLCLNGWIRSPCRPYRRRGASPGRRRPSWAARRPWLPW
jgi:putative endonuclease